MKLDFSLDLKKMAMLGLCFLLLSGLLIFAGYLLGLMSVQKEIKTGAATVQKEKGPPIKTASGKPSNNVVSQPVKVPGTPKAQSVPKPADQARPAGTQPGQAPAAPPKTDDSKKAAVEPAPPPGTQAETPAAAQSPGEASPKTDDSKKAAVEPAPAPESQVETPAAAQSPGDAPAKTDEQPGADAKPQKDAAATPEEKDAKAPPEKKDDAQTGTWKEGYTVQVGSFRFERNAMDMINEIRNMNYPAYMYLYTDSKGGVWHVVQVGEYDNRDKAIETATELKNKDIIALVKPITESIRQKRKAFTK